MFGIRTIIRIPHFINAMTFSLADPALLDDTEFGLAAYFFTRDNARIWRVGERLEYGIGS